MSAGPHGAGEGRQGTLTDDAVSREFAPWHAGEATPEEREAQAARLARLRERGHTIGEGCFVASAAAVHPVSLEMGDRSYIAAHAQVDGTVVLGADTTVNVGCAVRGDVRIGRAVRIGAYAAILGFTHVADDPEVEIYRQGLASRGVRIGDDVWIGAHATVLDGVTVGSHAIIGAGAVVTRDVPDYGVAVGNPARVVRDRREPRFDPDVWRTRIAALGARARAEMPEILARAWDGAAYRDHPDAPLDVRATCDAIELADLASGSAPPPLDRAAWATRLRALQEAGTGLVPEVGREDAVADPGLPFDGWRAYHVLSVGYALGRLGSAPLPFTAITDLDAEGMLRAVGAVDLEVDGWGAGAYVDALGTALALAVRAGQPVRPGVIEALLGAVAARRSPATGLWATGPTVRDAVNGTYRAWRGTLAQFGVTAPPDPVLAATVLDHAETLDWSSASACDGLDVAWLLKRAHAGASHPARTRAVAVRLLGAVTDAWVPGEGVPFEPGTVATLKGTEMQLAVAWNSAALLGLEDALGLTPRGVHADEPLVRLDAAARRWVAA